MYKRTSKAPSREILANKLAPLGDRVDTFHMRLKGVLTRLSTRPLVNNVDLKIDPRAITVWMGEDGQAYGIQQAQLLAYCYDKASWQREGQYNLSPESVKTLVHPLLELL